VFQKCSLSILSLFEKQDALICHFTLGAVVFRDTPMSGE